MDSTIEPGTVLAGKYRVESVLGEGGMGVVVEAVQLDLDRRVAIKLMLSQDHAIEAEALERFQREARAAARLRGDHVLRIHDFGRLEDDTPFIVMEFLEGADLRTTLHEQEILSTSDAVSYVLQACEGMAEAHAAGIVHRDLKPANLFLARRPDGRGVVKVLDFGISKLMAEGDLSVTKTDGSMGSPLYISPEQFMSAKNVTHATDIWALGAVLYELLTGRAAFAASSVPEVYARIMAEPPPSVLEHRPDVPKALEQVIHRCLERRGEARYRTVADLALALEPFAPKSAQSFVVSTVRIIKSSPLAHEGLAEVKDSLAPPPDDGGSLRRSGPDVSRDAVTQETIAVRAAPAVSASPPVESAPGSATGAAWVHDTQARARKKRQRMLIAGAALVLVLGVGLLWARSAAQPEERSLVSEPAAADTAAPVTAPELAPVQSVATSVGSAAQHDNFATEPRAVPPAPSASVAPTPPPAPRPQPRATAKKPPAAKPPATASQEDLLLHRR